MSRRRRTMPDLEPPRLVTGRFAGGRMISHPSVIEAAHFVTALIQGGRPEYESLTRIRVALAGIGGATPMDRIERLFDAYYADLYLSVIAETDGALDYEAIRFESYNRMRREAVRCACLELAFGIGAVRPV